MHICLTLIFLFSNTGSSVLEQYFPPPGNTSPLQCCVSLFLLAFRSNIIYNSLSATGIYHLRRVPVFAFILFYYFNTFEEDKIAKHALVFRGKGTEEEASEKRKVFTEDTK